MNKTLQREIPLMIELVDDDDDDDESAIIDDEPNEETINHRMGTHTSRIDQSRLNISNPMASNSIKRTKDISPCYVCGAKAHGYNFDQITCESCKAFFRRNALKPMDRFRCRNNDNCIITMTTRKRCKRCRLKKCFSVGMRKEWILSEEEKRIKRKKIERNRLIKQQAQLAEQQKSQHPNGIALSTNSGRNSGLSTCEFSPPLNHHQIELPRRNSNSGPLPLPLMCMYAPLDQQLYERQRCLLKQLSDGYQDITQQYPQPHKFLYRNLLISQTNNMERKISLVKDLTRELTQMTTSRLLHYFNLIPEFQMLSEFEKRAILIKNMLTVFMFHGALTYDAETNTFVDRNTNDKPYDANYLLLVYGPRVYNNFIALARGLTSAAYQSLPNKQSDERTHILFLLLMIVLLFTDQYDFGFDMIVNDHHLPISSSSNSSQTTMSRSLSTTSESRSSVSSNSSGSSSSSSTRFSEKLQKIQQIYIETACRYLYDEFGLTIGRQIFHNLLPLLTDLQRLCSTLANVNLCELADDEERNHPTIHSAKAIAEPRTAAIDSMSSFSAPETGLAAISGPTPSFNPTMISGRCHLNELQKENREPPPSDSSLTSRPILINSNISSSASPFILSDTITAFENHRLS